MATIFDLLGDMNSLFYELNKTAGGSGVSGLRFAADQATKFAQDNAGIAKSEAANFSDAVAKGKGYTEPQKQFLLDNYFPKYLPVQGSLEDSDINAMMGQLDMAQRHSIIRDYGNTLFDMAAGHVQQALPEFTGLRAEIEKERQTFFKETGLEVSGDIDKNIVKASLNVFGLKFAGEAKPVLNPASGEYVMSTNSPIALPRDLLQASLLQFQAGDPNAIANKAAKRVLETNNSNKEVLSSIHEMNRTIGMLGNTPTANKLKADFKPVVIDQIADNVGALTSSFDAQFDDYEKAVYANVAGFRGTGGADYEKGMVDLMFEFDSSLQTTIREAKEWGENMRSMLLGSADNIIPADEINRIIDEQIQTTVDYATNKIAALQDYMLTVDKHLKEGERSALEVTRDRIQLEASLAEEEVKLRKNKGTLQFARDMGGPAYFYELERMNYTDKRGKFGIASMLLDIIERDQGSTAFQQSGRLEERANAFTKAFTTRDEAATKDALSMFNGELNNIILEFSTMDKYISANPSVMDREKNPEIAKDLGTSMMVYYGQLSKLKINSPQLFNPPSGAPDYWKSMAERANALFDAVEQRVATTFGIRGDNKKALQGLLEKYTNQMTLLDLLNGKQSEIEPDAAGGSLLADVIHLSNLSKTRRGPNNTTWEDTKEWIDRWLSW